MTEYNQIESESGDLQAGPIVPVDQNEEPAKENTFKQFNWVMGVLIGVAFWQAFDNLAIGISLGMLFAIVFQDDKK